MTMTKKQRRARGLDRPASPPAPGALPWKARDILRQAEDGSTELIRWAISDADGNEIVHDMDSEALRSRIVAAVNFDKAASGRLGPEDAYLDPYSILEDALDILPVILSDREEATGEKDPVLRDLLKRIERAAGVRT